MLLFSSMFTFVLKLNTFNCADSVACVKILVNVLSCYSLSTRNSNCGCVQTDCTIFIYCSVKSVPWWWDFMFCISLANILNVICTRITRILSSFHSICQKVSIMICHYEQVCGYQPSFVSIEIHRNHESISLLEEKKGGGGSSSIF